MEKPTPPDPGAKRTESSLEEDLDYIYALYRVDASPDGTFAIYGPELIGRAIWGVTRERMLAIVAARWGAGTSVATGNPTPPDSGDAMIRLLRAAFDYAHAPMSLATRAERELLDAAKAFAPSFGGSRLAVIARGVCVMKASVDEAIGLGYISKNSLGRLENALFAAAVDYVAALDEYAATGNPTPPDPGAKPEEPGA